MWSPQPGPQLAAIEADWCPELLYGGARGGGKTDFLLGDWLQDVATYGPLWQGIVFRRTYDPELRETMARAGQLFPRTGAEWREGDREWKWPNGACLRLRYLERPEDATRYQGHAYTWIGWDELGQYKSDEGYRMMFASLRSAGGDVPTKRVRGTANPGGVGHLWVKGRFIDPAPGGYVPIVDAKMRSERMYIPSRVSDNRILMRSDPSYVDRLRGVGSEALVRAWLDGDWDIVEGAYFDNWRPDRHVIRPIELPAHWTRYRAMDWGSFRPFCVLWLAVSDGELPQFPRGALVVYREWYGMAEGQPNVGLKLDCEVVAQGILDREAPGEDVRGGIADPAIFQSDGGPSIAERMSRKRVLWKAGDNRRIPGWQQVRARLNGEEDRPLLYVFSTCAHLIRTLPAMQHDEHKPEDLDSDGEDHCADCLRYGIHARPLVADLKREERPRFFHDATLNELIAHHDSLRGASGARI